MAQKLAYIERYCDEIPLKCKIHLIETLIGKYGREIIMTPYDKQTKEVVVNITSLIKDQTFIDMVYSAIRVEIDKLNTTSGATLGVSL